ncbi:MAG: hypothetical protein Kow0069_34770 [Promethearchaeota archaeon]
MEQDGAGATVAAAAEVRWLGSPQVPLEPNFFPGHLEVDAYHDPSSAGKFLNSRVAFVAYRKLEDFGMGLGKKLKKLKKAVAGVVGEAVADATGSEALGKGVKKGIKKGSVKKGLKKAIKEAKD